MTKDTTHSNVTQCTMSDIPFLIEVCYKTGRTLNLIGNPGIGKTQIITQALRMRAEKEGLPLEGPGAPKLVTKVLSMCDRLDFAGQSVNHEKKTMEEVVADWIVDLSNEGNPDGPISILYLNEFNCVVESMKAVLYRLIEEKALGNYTIRENVQIIADGNPPAPGTPSGYLAWAEKRRVKTVEVIAQRPQWIDWANNNGIHPEVIAFLSQPTHFELFENFDPSKRERHAWANPASWHKLSDSLPHVEGASETLRMINAEGDIGKEAAARFVAWQSLGREAPDYMDALNDPESIGFSKLKADIQWFLLSQIGNASMDVKPKKGEIPDVTEKALNFACWLGEEGHAEFATFLTQFIVARSGSKFDKTFQGALMRCDAIKKLAKCLKSNKFLLEAGKAVASI